MWFLFVILVILACALCILVLVFQQKRKKVRKDIVRSAQKQWQKLDHIADPGRRILEAQSIVDRALNQMGYRGTFAEKLKRVQSHPQEFQYVWTALKLRNKIAHEPGIQITDQQARDTLKALYRFLQYL